VGEILAPFHTGVNEGGHDKAMRLLAVGAEVPPSVSWSHPQSLMPWHITIILILFHGCRADALRREAAGVLLVEHVGRRVHDRRSVENFFVSSRDGSSHY
jgi:hypothetical protein